MHAKQTKQSKTVSELAYAQAVIFEENHGVKSNAWQKLKGVQGYVKIKDFSTKQPRDKLVANLGKQSEFGYLIAVRVLQDDALGRLKYGGGSAVKDEYGLSVCVDEVTKTHVYLLEKTYINSDGEVDYRDVYDVLEIPAYLTFDCEIDKSEELDPEIIVLLNSYTHSSIELYQNDVLKAWRANTKTLRFEQVDDVQRIRCYNEGYGL